MDTKINDVINELRDIESDAIELYQKIAIGSSLEAAELMLKIHQKLTATHTLYSQIVLDSYEELIKTTP